LFHKGDLFLRQGPMELLGVRLVRITACQQAGAAGAAGGGREKGSLEAHSLVSETLEVGRHDGLVAKGGEVAPSQVVREDEHDVGEMLQRLELASLLEIRSGGPCFL